MTDAAQRDSELSDQSASVADSWFAAAWQEVSRLGLTEVLDHDARPSIIVDLHAVDISRGKWGRVYTNAAYEATPTSETWTKFERRDGRRVYTGPPDLKDWAYGYASSPDPVPIVRSDIWAVSRITLRSRWRILQAVKRNAPEDEDLVPSDQSKLIPIPKTAGDFAHLHPANTSPGSWSRVLEMARSTSESKSPGPNHVDGLSTLPFFAGVDWSLCSLGAPVSWPRWMQQLTSMVLLDLDPVLVIWKDRTVIYNELVVPLISQKHPAALGGDASVHFEELWSFLEPLIDTVMRTRKPRRIDAMPLPILRRGYLEETFWTFTLVPVFNDEGEVEGVLDRFNEATPSVLAARRLEQITQIGEKTSEASTLADMWEKVMDAMESHTNDSPYAMLFSIEDDKGQIPSYSQEAVQNGQLTLRLRGSVGMEGNMKSIFEKFNLADTDNCLAGLARQAFEENKPFAIRVLEGSLPEELHFTAANGRGFGDTVNATAIIPIMLASGKAIALLVKALNPRRLVDGEYFAFMRLMTRRLVEAFFSVFLPQEERNYRAEVEKTAMEQANLAQQLLIRTREAEHNAAAFARLASNAPLGMYMYTADGMPLYLNDYYFELTGISKDNFEKFSWMDGVHPSERDRLMQFWAQLYKEKTPVTFEFRMNRPYLTTDQNGSEVATEAWALASAFPQLDEEGEIINVIGWQIDISPQKWAQTLQKDRLKDALESRSQAHRFIDMVSHECRNPLSAILQSADGILTSIGSFEETGKGGIEMLKDSIDTIADSAQTIVLCAQHQKRIVDDILTVSKLDGNHLIITPDKADPVALVEHVLKMYEAELESDSIRAEIMVMDGYRHLAVDFVLLDPSRVLQILINMVTNAIKFTAPQKRRKITINIDATLRRPSEGLNGTTLIPQRSARLSPATTHPEWANGKDIFIQFSVKDTGRGMSPEEMERLFERFTQASPRTHVKYGGSGLGLFISRELTELQGGQVSVASTLGLGSTFAFYINARRSNDPLKNSQTPVYTPGPASNGSADHPHSPAYPFPHIPKSTSVPTSSPVMHLGSGSATPMQATPSQITPTQPPKTDTEPRTKLHVLIVEDNLINQKVMAKQLQRLGCTVHVANHGVEALDFLKISEFAVFPPGVCADDKKLDIILMDIEMPVMDGITCVREIRAMQRRGELHGHVPVIAVTANARDAQQTEAIEVGMDMVVTKPFRIPDLIPKIHDLVAEILASAFLFDSLFVRNMYYQRANTVCLFCRLQPFATPPSRVYGAPTQSVRNASTQRQRRKPARMALSSEVAKPSTRTAKKARAARQSRNSPWAGTNLQVAHMTRAPNARSQAELKRSSNARKLPDRAKKEQPDEKKGRLFHALKMQKRLSEISYEKRDAVRRRIAGVESFDQFDLLPKIQEAVKTDVFGSSDTFSPSAIQRLAIPALLGKNSGRSRVRHRRDGMEQFLLAAETGSGKTLAYLLPIIDAIKRAELEEMAERQEERRRVEERTAQDPTFIEPPPMDDRKNPSQARPRAIVLVPTAELVTQVTSVVKSLSHQVKFRSAAISSSYTPTVIRNRLFSESGIDVVVSTPQLLASICESDPNLLSRVTHLVIDEADSLLDRSFSPSTTSILDRASPSLQQLILCSATIPRSLDKFVRQRFPDIARLTTPNLHAIPRRVRLGTVDIEKEPYRGNRDLACADAIWTIGKEGAEAETLPDVPEADADSFVLKRILVFVNERETSIQVADYLQSKGIDAAALTRDTPEQRQAELLAAFTKQPTTKPEVKKWEGPQEVVSFKTANKMTEINRKLPNTKVLVTTDLGSRGIDTLAVRHVVLYDIPHTTIDFIHRLGRVGRMNRRGRGIVLVGRKDRKDVVAEVREAMFRGAALI